MKNDIFEKEVEIIIDRLKEIECDGETIQYIVEKVGMDEQLLKQLFMKTSDKELELLIELRDTIYDLRRVTVPDDDRYDLKKAYISSISTTGYFTVDVVLMDCTFGEQLILKRTILDGKGIRIAQELHGREIDEYLYSLVRDLIKYEVDEWIYNLEQGCLTKSVLNEFQRIITHVGMDLPENHMEIVENIVEDINSTRSFNGEGWTSEDVIIGFRRWIENK